MTILWPEPYQPSRTAVHVSNSLTVSLKPEVVWAWMIRAQLWPTWYPNSSHVEYLNAPGPDLQKGTRFRCNTFSVSIESEVLEFIPCERLAWSARGAGVDAYHAWLFQPTSILTEQTGYLARLGDLVMPNRMHKYH